MISMKGYKKKTGKNKPNYFQSSSNPFVPADTQKKTYTFSAHVLRDRVHPKHPGSSILASILPTTPHFIERSEDWCRAVISQSKMNFSLSRSVWTRESTAWWIPESTSIKTNGSDLVKQESTLSLAFFRPSRRRIQQGSLWLRVLSRCY